jgi:hypothetical protein
MLFFVANRYDPREIPRPAGENAGLRDDAEFDGSRRISRTPLLRRGGRAVRDLREFEGDEFGDGVAGVSKLLGVAGGEPLGSSGFEVNGIYDRAGSGDAKINVCDSDEQSRATAFFEDGVGVQVGLDGADVVVDPEDLCHPSVHDGEAAGFRKRRR